jgi:xanthine dehydrogenase accessory factor
MLAILAARLAAGEPVVVASVLATHGAVPRRRGAAMLVRLDGTDATIGGGEAEARVVLAARELLRGGGDSESVPIDLSGRPGAAGVCGGRMEVALRRWTPHDLPRVQDYARRLRAGDTIVLGAGDLGAPGPMVPAWQVEPDVRLLVVGGGHCGLALHRFARALDFDVWVHDARPECFAGDRFVDATVLCGGAGLLAEALDTQRIVFAVLVNRDFRADVAALEALATRPPAFIGMMGSRRRVDQVRAALSAQAQALATLHTPVGIDIDAQSPEEIAVSILAQLIGERRRLAKEPGT